MKGLNPIESQHMYWIYILICRLMSPHCGMITVTMLKNISKTTGVFNVFYNNFPSIVSHLSFGTSLEFRASMADSKTINVGCSWIFPL